jgi:suppressor of ftsI
MKKCIYGAFVSFFFLSGCSGGLNSGHPPAGTAAQALERQATVGPAGTDLGNPPEVASSRGWLNVQLTAAINPATGGPGIEWNGSFTPPTLRVWPGDTIEITYVNNLPASDSMPFNVANLHFHGLSVSPNPPADDAIDVYAMPGQTLHYVIPIPKSLPPGAYWYHSHSHFESDWQVLNGMSGAIVVNGTATYVPQTAGLPERVIVLRNVLAAPDFSNISVYPYKSRKALLNADQSNTFVPPVCTQGFNIPSEYTTINGQPVGATIQMQRGQRQLWRVVNASANGFYDVSVDGQTLQLVAMDGVPVTAYPGGSVQQVHDVLIPPAGRAEFIVTGPASGSAVSFRTTCNNTGPAGDPNPSQVLATIVSGSPQLPAVPAATPLQSGTYEESLGRIAQERTLTFTESSNGNSFFLNGQQYSPTGAPMFVAQSGTIERWTIVNSTHEVHAFHIHQVHFLVQDINGVPQPPVWRDTLTLPFEQQGTPGTVHVLIDFRDPVVRGMFLFHCHLLQHEDNGMMAKMLVI